MHLGNKYENFHKIGSIFFCNVSNSHKKHIYLFTFI